MAKKTKKKQISAPKATILKLRVLAKKKENVRGRLAVTAKELAAVARERESIRGRLEITAKEKETVRGKLALTAETLRLKAKQLATTAKENESIKGKLEITAKKLATTAKEKETVRGKLAVTAETLRLKAKQLATTARENESIKGKLEITAKQLAVIAKEREVVRRKLEVTAKELAATAKEKETVRGKLALTAETLRLKAKQLATTAKENESIKGKLEITAKKLAITAKERETVRRNLAVTAKQLAVVAQERESASKYSRSLIEASLDPLVTISPEGKITDVNKATIKVTGVSREKLIGTDFSNYFTEPEKALDGYKQVFKEGSVTDYPLTIRSADGKLTDVLYNASVYKDDKGNVLGVFAAARDVTETKKANELIESTNKELRALDLAKDEFVSVASHQLRTPLTALKGFTGMLIDGDAGPINAKQNEYLGEIKNANDRMISLINALLNVSRVDLGVFIVEPEPVNLQKVAESVLSELDIKIKEKRLQVDMGFEKDLPMVNADLKIVRMIFQNLLSNAEKYTPPDGSISFNIKKDGPNVLVSVTDSGYGIPENVQSKIFTKLFRADNARTKDPDGTGLGLYIIKATIEKTGGKIWFKSKENLGSTFYVTIPLEGMKKKEGSRRLE
jgi:PAS domain S-box-containing protein